MRNRNSARGAGGRGWLAVAGVGSSFSGASLDRFPGRGDPEGNNGRIAFGAFDANRPPSGRPGRPRPGEDDLHQLTDAPGRDICPAYSADGKHIAFCSDRTGAFEIWVMDTNGKHERQVTALGAASIFPDFSPEEGLLASFCIGTGRWRLHATVGSCRPRGRPDQLTTPRTPRGVRWSPDGTTILFVRIAGDFSGLRMWTGHRHGPGRPS